MGYLNAGTCEFLVGGDGSFVFLEMNARLQVEHPVTELVLARDLVADQLAIADGARLGDLDLDQLEIEERLARGGHAVEVRINAEDPRRGFLPSAGRVVAVRWPVGAASFGPVGESGVRVDAGIAAGDEVGGRFDPLLAKVIAVGPDRATALSRLASALDGTELLGLATNIAFLRRLVRLPVVADGRARSTRSNPIPTLPPSRGQAPTRRRPTPPGKSRRARWPGAPARTGPGAGGGAPNGPGRLRLSVAGGEEAAERAVATPPLDRAGTAPFAALSDGIVHVSVEGASVAFRLAVPAGPRDGGSPTRPTLRGGGGCRHRRSSIAPMPGLVVAVHVQRRRPGRRRAIAWRRSRR